LPALSIAAQAARPLAGERPGRRRLSGMMVIIAGLAITAGPGLLESGSAAWKGDLLFAAAGTMWALFTVLQRRWRVDAIAVAAVVSVLSGLFYAPVYLAWRGTSGLLRVDPSILIQQAIVLGALAGVVALFAIARAAEYLGAGRASLFPAFAPGIAILLGIPLSGEAPTVWQVLALLVLSEGLLLALHTPHAQPVPKLEMKTP
jgi:drug/metabolite transporter (DMT)-like permease